MNNNLSFHRNASTQPRYPVRQCVICRRRLETNALYRFTVMQPQLKSTSSSTVICQNVTPVPRYLRHLLRRSVYLCHDGHCIGSKGLAQRLQRSLKHPMPADLITALFGKALIT